MASFSLSLLPANDDHGCLCPILIHHKPTTEIKYPPHHAPQTDHLTIVTASWSPHKGHHALVTILWPPHHSTHPSLSQDIRLETFQTWQNNNSLHLLVLPGGCHHAVATRRGCQQLDWTLDTTSHSCLLHQLIPQSQETAAGRQAGLCWWRMEQRLSGWRSRCDHRWGKSGQVGTRIYCCFIEVYCRTPDQTKIKIKWNQKSGEAL